MSNRKLNIGIMLDSYEVPAWAYSALERVTNLECVEISLIIMNWESSVYSSKLQHLWKSRSKIAYFMLDALDRRLFRCEPDAFANMDLKGMVANVPTITVKPIRKNYSDSFSPGDIERIRGHKLDVIVRMGFRILRGDILNSSTYGIWSYHHGDNRKKRGGPPGFWEVVEWMPETGSVLQILTEELDGGHILYRSWSCTYPLSPYRNRNLYFWTSSTFMSRQIALLHRLGKDGFFSEIQKYNCEFEFNDNKLYSVPSNINTCALAVKLIMRSLLRALGKLLYREQWILMFYFSEEIATSLRKYRKIIPPKDRFWADPHVVKQDDTYYIFIEEYIYKTKLPHISVIEMDKLGNYKQPVPVLQKEYHLSYPFVFKWEDTYYMIPETQSNKTIELYECAEFPYRWEFKMNLMENVKAVDATLLRHEGKWWLFAGMREQSGSSVNDELFLFFSEELLSGEWQPHPLNPVMSDVRQARPAGKIFRRNGKIIRPSMNCSLTYGRGFNMNEIVLLSTTEYRERRLCWVLPQWDEALSATHTFTHEGDLNIIDAIIQRNKCF